MKNFFDRYSMINSLRLHFKQLLENLQNQTETLTESTSKKEKEKKEKMCDSDAHSSCPICIEEFTSDKVTKFKSPCIVCANADEATAKLRVSSDDISLMFP